MNQSYLDTCLYRKEETQQTLYASLQFHGFFRRSDSTNDKETGWLVVWLIPFPRLSVKPEQKAVYTFVSIGWMLT